MCSRDEQPSSQLHGTQLDFWVKKNIPEEKNYLYRVLLFSGESNLIRVYAVQLEITSSISEGFYNFFFVFVFFLLVFVVFFPFSPTSFLFMYKPHLFGFCSLEI